MTEQTRSPLLALLRVVPVLAGGLALSGCIVLTAADLAVGTVRTAAGITGAVVGGAVDLVTESEEERAIKAEKEAKKAAREAQEAARQAREAANRS
jgi:hypothetical protein